MRAGLVAGISAFKRIIQVHVSTFATSACTSDEKEGDMSRDKPQAESMRKHPEPYQHDLNPDAMAGQNIGIGEAQPAKQGPTAYDVKPVHERLKQFSDAELKQL